MELTLRPRIRRDRVIVDCVTGPAKGQGVEPNAEDRLRSRLDATSAALAALAHEINQPLAATAAYLDVARRILGGSPGKGEEIAQILEKAAAQTQRASRLVSTLRGFALCEDAAKTSMGLHEAISDALDSLRAEDALAGMEVTLEPAALRDQILADRLQIRLALCHLVRDAAATMRSTGGRGLAIRTCNPDAATIKVDMIDAAFGPQAQPESLDGDQLTVGNAKGMRPGLLSSVIIIEELDGLIWAGAPCRGAAHFSFTLPLLNVDVVS